MKDPRDGRRTLCRDMQDHCTIKRAMVSTGWQSERSHPSPCCHGSCCNINFGLQQATITIPSYLDQHMYSLLRDHRDSHLKVLMHVRQRRCGMHAWRHLKHTSLSGGSRVFCRVTSSAHCTVGTVRPSHCAVTTYLLWVQSIACEHMDIIQLQWLHTEGAAINHHGAIDRVSACTTPRCRLIGHAKSFPNTDRSQE